MLLTATLLLAADLPPLADLEPLDPGPGGWSELVLDWAVVGLVPAGAEAAAIGPGRLAIGPDGAWAVWDVVNRRVVASVGVVDAPVVDGLAFAPDGDLLWLRGRTLTRLDGATSTSLPLPGLVPAGAELEVWNGVAMGVDALGNGHPIARVDGPTLAPAAGPSVVEPRPALTLLDGVVSLDGVVVARDVLAARRVGDCAVVERGRRGAVSGRDLACPGARRSLPLGGVYTPVGWIAADGEGGHAWLDPRADGLHLVRVAR